MPKRILFVDEERFVHKALQRSFRKMSGTWEMRFASSTQSAIEYLDDIPADVIVTETMFSSRDGIEFLETIRDSHPEAARIILSGYAGEEILLKSVDLAHQYLAKPCDHDTLRATITRAFIVKELLDDSALKQVVSKIDSLPSVPALYIELVEELKSEDGSIARVGDIIAKDMGLTAKILKLVNSAFFGLPQHISNPAKAASLLGVDLIKAIVLTHGTFDQFNHLRVPGFSLDELWQHSMSSAACAKIIAQRSGLDQPFAEAAFMSGLLHDIGKLLVAAHIPEKYMRIHRMIEKENVSAAKAEKMILGTTHAAVGAYLLGLWGLPDGIIQATAFHHHPASQPALPINTATITHVANAVVKAGPAIQETIDAVDSEYLENAGLLSQLSSWHQGCRDYLEADAE